MTISKYDKYAFTPKRCNKCNRLFVFEPYNIYYRQVGIESFNLKQIECKKCSDGKKVSKCVQIITKVHRFYKGYGR